MAKMVKVTLTKKLIGASPNREKQKLWLAQDAPAC